MTIRTTAEHVVYENAYVRVHDDDVVFPSGRAGRHLKVRAAADGVPAVVWARCGGKVALVHTYRYPIGAAQWGLPRGFAHGDALETAAFELAEEVGVVADQLRVLGHVTPDSGLLASRVAVVLADCSGTRCAPVETDEVDAVLWVTPDRLRDRIRGGEVEDGFTLAAFALATAHDLT